MFRALAALSLFALPLLALPLPANAGDAFSQRVRVSGYVPVECRMDLTPNFRQVGADAFELGSIQRFCNTGYTLQASFQADATGGDFTYDGATAPAAVGNATLALAGKPTRRPTTLRLQGVGEATARDIASTLVLQVQPTGL